MRFHAEVQCYQWGQLLAEGNLGDCIYRSFEEFCTMPNDYFAGMVREVTTEAAFELATMHEKANHASTTPLPKLPDPLRPESEGGPVSLTEALSVLR